MATTTTLLDTLAALAGARPASGIEARARGLAALLEGEPAHRGTVRQARACAAAPRDDLERAQAGRGPRRRPGPRTAGRRLPGARPDAADPAW